MRLVTLTFYPPRRGRPPLGKKVAETTIRFYDGRIFDALKKAVAASPETSMNTWILQAICERVERTKRNGGSVASRGEV